jgi:hypothetical protein
MPELSEALFADLTHYDRRQLRTEALRMYDSVRWSGKLGGTDMFNLAGGFDRRPFWIYARHATVGVLLLVGAWRACEGSSG